MERSYPQALIFDCDGTLVDSMGMWLKVSPRLLASYGIQATSEDFARFEHLALEEECAAYHDVWGIGADGHEVYERMFKLICEAYATCIPERPGVHAFLDQVREAGIPMAIATSTAADAVRVGLEANGLQGYFSNITTTAETGVAKDRPDVYDHALDRLAAKHGLGQVKRSQVWVFEDAVFGLKSSGEAGYRRVGIYDPAGRARRDDVRANCEIFIDTYEGFSLDRLLDFEA